MGETNLSLTIGGFPPLSARGCRQSLFQTSLGDLRRTINGHLVFTGGLNQKKYASIIHGKDKAPPALEGLWPGQSLRVQCLSSLTQKITGNGKSIDYKLDRVPVQSSVEVYNEERKTLSIDPIKEKSVFLKKPLKDKQIAYISYRPFLNMKVVSFSQETDEWNMNCAWTLKLEEI